MDLPYLKKSNPFIILVTILFIFSSLIKKPPKRRDKVHNVVYKTLPTDSFGLETDNICEKAVAVDNNKNVPKLYVANVSNIDSPFPFANAIGQIIVTNNID